MNLLNDTIAAISTPPGEGGIGIVRLSGKNAIAIADRLFSSPKGKKLIDAKSHTIIYGFIVDPKTDEKIDEALVSIMRAPMTYTKENVIEINCHGGMLPIRKTLELILKDGARLAEPGEFTKRAFLNGRLDLSQAEAVIDIIRAKTEQAEKIALQQLEGRLSVKITEFIDRIINICAHIEACIDFPEDEIDTMTKDEMVRLMQTLKEELMALAQSYDYGRLFREGISAAIVGKPNVGKSSLLNALLRKDRAIVTEMPGTTRDVIEDCLNINGLPLIIMDTAGIRETHDLAEMEGVKRSLKAIDSADIVLAVMDASRPFDEADKEVIDRVKDKKTVVVINKSDLLAGTEMRSTEVLQYSNTPIVKVSALKGGGLDDLKNAIYSLCISPVHRCSQEGVLITNLRHRRCIKNAVISLGAAIEDFEHDKPLEIIAISLRESLDSISEITGAVSTEDILNKIFSEFCIGK
jgi:tRNA modification GTPase